MKDRKMKNSVQKVAIILAVVTALMMSLVPAANAHSRDGDQALAARADTQHGICRIDGANICPPKPLEIVWICHTYSMLAGTTCPDMSDVATVGGSVKITANVGSTQAALPSGNCVGVNACNDFIAECIGAGGDYVPEHDHGETGQPNLGSCGPVQD